MGRARGVCMNCQQPGELVAHGICKACYMVEWRELKEVRPDRFSSNERKHHRKIRRVVLTLVDGFEEAETLGFLETLPSAELLRDLIQQLVGEMHRVVGESLQDREVADLEPAPERVKEYGGDEEEGDDDEEDPKPN